ncbi:MAG: ABC transporter ATP-binding protein [Planctomycetota bacterium]|nr:MAG: ABC transporter ATP-binding protein [Planctomycetota bacterium]
MSILINAQDLHKSYAGKVICDAISLAITDRMKLGLIGANGTGKTTILRILLGEEEADSGVIHRDQDLRIGLLPQHDPFTPEETVAEFLERWSEQASWTCAALAARFGISTAMLDQPLGTLSGGWRTRAKLCAVILREPNILILDEPTNFLDLRTQLLLEDFLASWSGASLVISHDRPFLQATCTHTAELCGGRLRLHPGPVNAALQAWREEEERLAGRAANLASKAKQLQQFVDSNRANANTASQARSKAKQLARIQDAIPDIPSMTASAPTIRVPSIVRRDGPACHLEDIAIGYGQQAVATCHHLEIQRGERLAVMGDNGQGKTTLLRTLVDDLPLVGGHLRWTHGAEIALYAQHVYQKLGSEGTVLQHLSAQADDSISSQEILNVAGSFLFSGDDVQKPLAVCSGGERARVVLAGILLSKASVLVLDEPTNHLDVATIDSLADALCNYGGTVIMASHDRRFVEHVATGIVEVDQGTISRWPGVPADYCDHIRKHQRSTPAPTSSNSPPTASHQSSSKVAPGHAKRHRQLQKTIASLERSTQKLEREREHLNQEMATCNDPQLAEKLLERSQKISREIASNEERWLLAQEDLENLATA